MKISELISTLRTIQEVSGDSEVRMVTSSFVQHPEPIAGVLWGEGLEPMILNAKRWEELRTQEEN